MKRNRDNNIKIIYEIGILQAQSVDPAKFVPYNSDAPVFKIMYKVPDTASPAVK